MGGRPDGRTDMPRARKVNEQLAAWENGRGEKRDTARGRRQQAHLHFATTAHITATDPGYELGRMDSRWPADYFSLAVPSQMGCRN